MSARGWSEDSVHRWLARTTPRGLSGSPMHDAAVLQPLRGRLVACADQCIEGVHFEPDVAPRAIGRKAALRALSDLAATAAAPVALLLTLRAPRERTERWIRAAIAGVRDAAREHGADLVGGDLACAAGPAQLSVAAFGAYEHQGRPVGRDRARAGDVVVLTGPCGGSILGRHLAIEPRFAEAEFLVEQGARALMDVSDGLAWDLARLARSSRVRIALELARVAAHADARRLARASGRPPLDHALHDGEDHELVATLPRARWDAARARAARLFPRLVAIGRVERGAGVQLVRADGGRERWSRAQGGFEHGR